MTTPVSDNGATQQDIDRQNIDQETALAVEYLLYQGFDLKKLATSAAATQKVSTLSLSLVLPQVRVVDSNPALSRVRPSRPAFLHQGLALRLFSNHSST